ncbi:MAG: Zn-ribbon domain-containing OB-fold protein [Candidatus Heimdallarchaeota archaeon]|nr:Zn-ribbon domain-containing OB-fold protein [Candidatus Heimdallarchaeota archaeon]MCG3256953.1 Zn-ribbon domain-containing OB-fold protein [Candidatus Heimdallarchaeota archaeon]MCK4612016.1 Zn-ribbon domain-containing OB-fold protein [Candidatus Heimdallarchaeota archaeon]
MEPPKIWRERREKYLALGVLCHDCKKKNFPITQRCPDCTSGNIEEVKLAQTGKILYFTRVSQTAKEMMFYAPYIVALIELDDRIRVTGQITDTKFEDLTEGMKVRMVFRTLSKNGEEGLIGYGFKFVHI